MRGQERGRSLEINSHTPNSAAIPLPNLERFGRVATGALCRLDVSVLPAISS
jgi:hypothetical protein